MSSSEGQSTSPPDLSTMAALVCSFAREMNEWEESCYGAWSAHIATYIHDAPTEAAAAYAKQDREIQDSYKAKYVAIFSKYCTPRKRTHGGPDAPLSARIPTKYEGVCSASLQATELVKKNRAELIFQTDGPVVNYKFKFVVLRTKEGWQIDGYKYQFRGAEKWNVGIL